MKDTAHQEFGRGGRYHVPSLGEIKHDTPLRRPSTGLIWAATALGVSAIICVIISVRLESVALLVVALLIFAGCVACSIAYQLWSWRYNDDASIAATIGGCSTVVLIIAIGLIRILAG